MKLNKKFYILIIIFFLFSVSVFFVSAEERGLETQYPIIDGQEITTSTTIAEYAVYIFKFSIILAAIIAFAVLIYGGFRYVTSSGNPLAMDDAKKWILSAIIGLALILFSYIILNIINANFIKPKVEVIEPVGGILLTDENGVSRPFYSTGEVSEIPEDFKATKIEFITDNPAEEFYYNPNKEELISIFYYEEINQGGKVAVVPNNKEPDSPSPSSPQPLDFAPKSIYFLWQKPGVYLYENEDHKTPPVPKIFTKSQKTLKDFSDKLKSLAFVNEKQDNQSFSEEPYQIVLFEDTDYEGTCDIMVTPEHEDIVNRLKGKVSSIAVSQGMLPYGEVLFYDKINCEMEGGKEPYAYKSVSGMLPTGMGQSLSTDTTGLDQWLSIKINGNFSVLLTTKKDLDDEGRCLIFSKIGCVSSFKGTSVYSADPKSFRPEAAYILPTTEK